MQDAQVTRTQEAACQDEPDALFGVLQSIGEDLGINPFYLRVAFIAGVFLSPVAMIASYVALGAVVALSRWLFPKPRAAAEQPTEQPERQDVEEREPELIAA